MPRSDTTSPSGALTWMRSSSAYCSVRASCCCSTTSRRRTADWASASRLSCISYASATGVSTSPPNPCGSGACSRHSLLTLVPNLNQPAHHHARITASVPSAEPERLVAYEREVRSAATRTLSHRRRERACPGDRRSYVVRSASQLAVERAPASSRALARDAASISTGPASLSARTRSPARSRRRPSRRQKRGYASRPLRRSCSTAGAAAG